MDDRWRHHLSPPLQFRDGTEETSPGSLLEIKCDRSSQIVLARLTSSHLDYLSYDSGREIHPTCKKCFDPPASSDHIRKYIGLSKIDLTSDPLITIDFWYDAERPVQDVLQNRLILQLEEWFPNGKPYIVMQDGAPCHTARSIKAFLAEQNIPLLDWPGNSPDMNPIENI
ncbi:uncharacterized protein TNCV_4666801 [Trichonephila clavipes]|nr:uncharacterized protein TNCV_4666801 [Trichonephila clavipes]